MTPRVVLVTGAPGSGKSTLAHSISMSLRIPCIARDEIRGGLLFSAGAWGESLERVSSADEAADIFLETIEQLLRSDVSCVAEYLFRAHRSDDLTRILAVGDAVVVRTVCRNPIERFAERNRRDLLISQRAVLDATGFEDVEAHTADAVERMRQAQSEAQTEFPIPVLDVTTDDGYDPSLQAILDFAVARG